MFKEIRGDSFEGWIVNKKKLMNKYSARNNPNSYIDKSECWNCNGKLFESSWSDLNGDKLFSCNSCGLIQCTKIPSYQLLSDFYNDTLYSDFYQSHVIDNHNKRKELFGRQRVTDWINFFGKNTPQNVLEIGCGSGFTLSAAKDNGFEVTGLELNQKCVDFCHKQGLFSVYNESLEEFTKKSDVKFDIVGMYDVLEHLTNPRETIQNIKNLLKPGGLLSIYVPNSNSFIINILDSSRTQWVWQPFHLSYFNEASLGYLLKDFGFQAVHVDTVGMDIYDICNFLGQSNTINSKTVEPDRIWDAQQELQKKIDTLGLGSILRYFSRKVD